MQQFQPLVANAKLDRLLNSHPPLSRELMLTRLEADDWRDTTDGTQYEQEDHGYTEHYDDSYDHDYQEHQEHQEHDTEHYYQSTGSEEQGYAEDLNENGHTQEETPQESEDDYQEERRSGQSSMESGPVLMEIHLSVSEARLTNDITNDGNIIPAGSRTICHAESSIITTGGEMLQNIHTKLDTCGSISIAHSSYLTQVKRATEHGLPQIRLT
jgi:hypothetical protein